MTTVDRDGARRLVVDDQPVTPADIQVSHVVSVDEDGILVAGTDDPTEAHLWRVGTDGSPEPADGAGRVPPRRRLRRHPGAGHPAAGDTRHRRDGAAGGR